MAPESSYRVTLLQSKAVSRDDGQVALVLTTKELGHIAFRVDEVSIDQLRAGIAEAETMLSRQGRSVSFEQ